MLGFIQNQFPENAKNGNNSLKNVNNLKTQLSHHRSFCNQGKMKSTIGIKSFTTFEDIDSHGRWKFTK